jgi:hypothetical protein
MISQLVKDQIELIQKKKNTTIIFKFIIDNCIDIENFFVNTIK